MKFFASLIIWLVSIFWVHMGYAQTLFLPGSLRPSLQAENMPTPTRTTQDIDQQINTLETALKQAEQKLIEQTNRLKVLQTKNDPDIELLNTQAQTLTLVVARYQHAIDGLRNMRRLADAVDQKKQELKNWQPPSEGPPWSLQKADETYLTIEESTALRNQYHQHNTMLVKTRESLLKEKSALEKKIREMQASHTTALTARDQTKALIIDSLKVDLKAVELEFLFADIFVQTNLLNEVSSDLIYQISSKDWAYMNHRFYFDALAYQRVMQGLNTRIGEAQVNQKTIRQEVDQAIIAFKDATVQLENLLEQPNSDPSAILAAQQALTLADDRARLKRMQTDMAFYFLEELQVAKQLWEIRFQLYNNQRGDLNLQDIYRLYGILGDEILDWQKYDESLLSVLRNERQAMLDSATLSSTEAESDFIRTRATNIQSRIDEVGKSLANLASVQFLLNLTLQEINYFQHNASIWQRVKYFANNFDEFLVSVWQYEMFTVSDTVVIEGRSITTQRSVTIGKSIGAMAILIFGLLLVKRIMSRTMQFAMRRTNIRASTLLIFTRWATLIAGMSLIIFSLILVDIPLSIFAFAGGALAIGIGFGAQNLLQNLISGLMLLIEKPVRVGDWIEVGGLTGTITSIGFRFSVLLSPTGTENIVPNSVLVQENLVNWTYSSPNVRREIQVWVDYKIDPETVTNILKAVASDHPVVLKTPEPRVLLDSFTERGMLFKLQFWAPMSAHLSGPVIMSEVRRELHARFTEYGIEFAYPHQSITIQRPPSIADC